MVSWADDQDPSEEILCVRRILELWKDRELSLAVSQIDQFLQQHPQSKYTEQLLALLGDIYWMEKNYGEALRTYDRIVASECKESIFNHRLDCLYHQGNFSALSDEALGRLPSAEGSPKDSEEALWMFYYAESLMHLAKDAQDQEALEKAQNYYEYLLETEHDLDARLALAHLNSRLGNHTKAAIYYLELAEKLEARRGEMLFLAAQEQSKIDPIEAIGLYERILEIGGYKESQAALNKLILLFNLEQYDKVLQEKEVLQKAVALEHAPFLELYLGRSCFALNRYEEAICHLQPLLTGSVTSTLDLPTVKMVLMTLIASHFHLNQIEELQRLSKKFEKKFPADSSLPKVLFIQALTLKNCQRFQESLEVLDHILRRFPNYEKFEEVEFEKCLALYKLGHWLESRACFLDFVSKYEGTKSPLVQAALHYVPNSTLQWLESSVLNGEESLKFREQLLEDVEWTLNHPETVQDIQTGRLLLMKGKALHELNRDQEAVDALHTFVEQSEDPGGYQGHLMMAICYYEGLKDLNKFIYHAEKVLEIKPGDKTYNWLRINLFSVYLQLVREQNHSVVQFDDRDYLNKAAGHLYEVLSTDSEKIKQENKLWLANYYYNKVKQGLNEYVLEPLQNQEMVALARRCQDIYEKVLAYGDHKPLPTITSDTVYLEQEYFKLSNIYGWLSERRRQLNLLKALVHLQRENKEWSWSLRTRTVFALADAYHHLGEDEMALENYTMLTTALKTTDPYIFNGSKLAWARLKYARLPQEKRMAEDPDMRIILKTLKDLQIRRTLEQEPIHLEAALEYVFMREALEPQETRTAQALFLLGRLKDCFSNKQDLWSKEYNESRKQHPEKDFIYQAYMMLVEAHILRLEAKLALEKGEIPEQQVKNEAAKAIYKSLINGKFAVSKYLTDQAKSSLLELMGNSLE
jgi:outer membrane protein assembly factor BamD (BamD/ComL family)